MSPSTVTTAPGSVTVRRRAQYEALQDVRRRQATDEWKRQYDRRAGVEGTISQSVRLLGLRLCRYRGLARTRLQHILTAAGLNVLRLDAWLAHRPLAKTRTPAFAALWPLVA